MNQESEYQVRPISFFLIIQKSVKNCPKNKSNQNLSLYSLQYAEACNELAGLFSASLRLGNTTPFEEMSQRGRAVGNIAFDLTGPRFEPQTSCFRDERVTAPPTGRFQK